MFVKLTALTLAALIAVAQAAPSSVSVCDCPKHSIVIAASPAIQCAYPEGACTYDEHGILLNKNQSNCEQKIFFNANACPKDRTGSKGVLINKLLSFTCDFVDIIQICTFDATGTLVKSGSSRICPPSAPPCVTE